MSRRGRRAGEDRGAVVILVALAVAVMLSFLALVVDLAQLRTDRRVNKTVVDMAARAGLGVLQAGPWSGVCRARDYLRANSPDFSDFDAGGEGWFQLGTLVNGVSTSVPVTLTSSPCLNTGSAPYNTLCLPGPAGSPRFDTWGKLTATAGGGRFTIEIQSGYRMPDSRFGEDAAAASDTGDPLKGYCDNLVVIITERRTPLFGGVTHSGQRSTTIRSVGRLSSIVDLDFNPALLLLEQHRCSVLTVNSNGARVIAQPYQDHPGVIQIDSADDQGGCASNQAVLNGAATAAGPSIVVCSARTANPTPGCNPATADKPSRVGLYALNFAHPAGDYVTSDYPSTYGDTQAVRSAQSGRTPLDAIYRTNVRALDADAQSVLTGNGGLPPGCGPPVLNLCTGSNGLTWLVLRGTDCNSLATFFSPVLNPGRTALPNIWFDCGSSGDLSVNTPLTLTGPDAFVVVVGQLQVSSTFAMTDPRKVYIGGRSSGNKIGLDIGNGANFNVNNLVAAADPTLPCTLPAVVKTDTVVVGNGSFNMASGGAAHLCQSFVFMASGYGKVPATDGTPPCGSPCSGYLGTVGIGSGATVDWTAPNLVSGRRPTQAEVLGLPGAGLSTPYEDLGLWTEAGGNTNSIGGGGNSRMTGVYFLGNADSFTLAGNASGSVSLSAQFISTSMKVTGGSTVNLVLSPYDTVPVVIYQLVLVR
ncbi:MAG: Tad domain-containing protein [Actinobacteria bacterium]|nr:Tad domain-containing protein [Actinomycetota bacterium]